MEKSLKILKLNEFVLETFGLKEHEGILIIVDVQKEFGDFIPKDFVSNLTEYCKEFKTVYQIWDYNSSKTPTFKFPNQAKSIKKRFGKSFLGKDIVERLESMLDEKKEGEILILDKFDAQFVRINNKHQWFMVNGELLDLLNSLSGKKVILVGGADNECLEDVNVACKTFGLKVALNHNHIYSAEDKQEE